MSSKPTRYCMECGKPSYGRLCISCFKRNKYASNSRKKSRRRYIDRYGG